MRYRKTKLTLPPKGRPLDKAELIKRAVEVEEAKELYVNESSPKLPVYVKIKPMRGNPGWFNFFRATLLEFRP